MRTEVERLRAEHITMQADIRQRFPEMAILFHPKPATLTAVGKALAPGEALVSIYLGETQSYVWTVGTQGKTSFRVVPMSRAAVADDVAQLRLGTVFKDDEDQPPVFDVARASKLYQAFLAPDAELWQDAKVLSVIPHGALGQIPFALLPTGAIPVAKEGRTLDKATPWLIRKVAIAQLPSANAFLALRRSQVLRTERGSFIGFGDPIFVANAGVATKRGRARNLQIGKEADTVMEQLTQPKNRQPISNDKDAGNGKPAFSQCLPTPSGLTRYWRRTPGNRDGAQGGRGARCECRTPRHGNRGQANQSRAAPSGCICHPWDCLGELTGLDQPALVLSNPALTGEADADGFLTMDEVLGLKLDADWVVLSACNTASSDGKASEAVSGLGRAFFFAGARSLLVTNWAVETTSARLLTTSLFRREVENPALTRAEALRQAMLDVMNSGDEKVGLSYAHPAFWAPFSLVGDGVGRR